MTARGTDRTRAAILEVAGEALMDPSGVAPAMEEIARRARLGRSTVYRYFRNRHDLAEAVMAERIGQLSDALAEVGSGCHAFRDLLSVVLRTQVRMRPLVALIRQLPDREQQLTADRLARVLTPHFERARAAGEIRPDARATDVKLILAMLEAAAGQAGVDGTDIDSDVTRMIEVLLDGLFGRADRSGT